ncbi:MAG: efflux RND transporter permease subunit, partial [Synechococcaceae cyanobacterium RL_1_2]|nr:efflux RND transporter permease subunit [Synechococcaceae cyanobacterium RL_1_2]
MSFHLSVWSIKKPVPTLVLFLVLSIVGFFSFLGLGIDNNPNIDVPAITITVNQAGASPTELETEVTKTIEDAVAGLGNIDDLTSVVSEGTSQTTVTFVLGTDTEQATNDVRNAVSQVRSQLPDDILEPIVRKLDFVGGSIITYAVQSPDRSVEELSDLVDRVIAKEILSVEGVGTVDRIGGVDREIRVDLSSERLQAYNLTTTEVNNQIANFNLNLPSGRSEIGGIEQNVRAVGSAKTVEEIQNYGITLPTGATVALKELGTVTDGFGEARQTAYLNGKPVVAFSVRRSTGSTLVTVEQGVRQVVEQLPALLPQDVTLDLIFT